MRIGINGIFWHRPGTGSGQYVRALVAAMARQNAEDDLVVIHPAREETGAQIRALDEISPRVLLYPEAVWLHRLGENLAKVWFEQLAFGNTCRRENVALAHVPYFAPPLFPPTRTIVTIHDLIPLILPMYRGSLLVQLYTNLAAAAAHRARAILADSESTKRDIVEYLGIRADRVHVVYLAADARFQPIQDGARIQAVRRKYHLPERFILYLGGLDQRKNLRVLMEAFALLLDYYNAGYRLVIGGASSGIDSAFFPDPLRLARQAGLPEDAVLRIGWVIEEDKPALYASATAFVFPSLYEGFGLPPLEAMACGTPVIVSNTSSLPEVVGDAGMQVDPRNPDEWADALRALLSDEPRRREMRARGIAEAAKFSWERAAKETLAVYERVLSA